MEKERDEGVRFDSFDFTDDLLDGLDAMGFQFATPIQEQAIPIINQGKDLIACAQTGTGKTAAFLLPILNKIIDEGYPENDISVLIIVPTRELALQIDQQIEGFSYYLGVSSLPIYGGGDGQSWEQQRTALTKGVDIVVATPGRLIQHLNMSYSNFSNVKHLILDEADRM
ncbi:MAG: DEAD/DEAH box helicase, partial [Bacteroidota bacterium]